MLRRLHSNVCNNIEIEKFHRTEIVRNLISYVQEEGVKSKIFLIDIKSFYESIDIDVLLKNKSRSLTFLHSKNLIRLI